MSTEARRHLMRLQQENSQLWAALRAELEPNVSLRADIVGRCQKMLTVARPGTATALIARLALASLSKMMEERVTEDGL